MMGAVAMRIHPVAAVSVSGLDADDAERLRERLAVAGVRFNDLVTDYRCRLAKELLLKTDERIEVIVERTGFSEPSTFYRAFKRWVGETPVEFRRRGRPQPPAE